jgi:hypothetical protein
MMKNYLKSFLNLKSKTIELSYVRRTLTDFPNKFGFEAVEESEKQNKGLLFFFILNSNKL